MACWFWPHGWTQPSSMVFHRKISGTCCWKPLQKLPKKNQCGAKPGRRPFKGIQDVANMKNRSWPTIRKKMIREQSREDLKNLNLRWLDEMINNDEAQLREKMSLFWHGHFACRVINSYFQQELLQTIREMHWAILRFANVGRKQESFHVVVLNNQQNKNAAPQQRKLRPWSDGTVYDGCGNYTENDIKEAARPLPAGVSISGANLNSGNFSMIPATKPCWVKQVILTGMMCLISCWTKANS